MRFDRTFLRSKVARRIFLLFVFCALLPITGLAVISFSHVTKQLNTQSQKRLRQASKAAGLAIYERLLFVETEMKMVISSINGGQTSSNRFGEGIKKRFVGLGLIVDGGRHQPLFGRIQDPPEPTLTEKSHISSGKTLLSSHYRPDLPARIFMSRALDPSRPERGILVGEVNPVYLWGMGDQNTLPPMTEMCVLDQSNRVLFCSLPDQVSFPAHAGREMTRSAKGKFEWKHAGGEYLASYWSIPTKFAFFYPKCTVVLSESKAAVLAPMADFKKTFPLVVLLSLWVVLLLSISQIRRNLVPLEKLQEGTRRIAARDFESRVVVSSADEFQELAASFNTMASRLGSQFNTLAMMAEIDRAILSALDTETIVDTILTRMRDVFPCSGVAVTLLDSAGAGRARTYIRDRDPTGETLVEAIELKPEEVQKLRNNPESLFIDKDEGVPHYLAPAARNGIRSFLVLSILVNEKLSGIIGLGLPDPPIYTLEDLVQARQLADQVAVALSNALLIEELEKLNWGTLTALARAIDAKSSWTAGHSERVTALAVKIGRVLGLSPKELDVLHRGGLLHDIGKIGVPATILDKPGRLTEEEVRLMREHPRKGARILEPIPAYADVIPIVLQHHEWFDGTGYPDGLAGEDISVGGRIFAVADVFDALVSSRPYRSGWSRAKATELIKQGANSQFDPKMVQAFLEVMAQDERESIAEEKYS